MAGALHWHAPNPHPRCPLSVKPLASGPQFPSYEPQIGSDCDARSPEVLQRIAAHRNQLAKEAATANDARASGPSQSLERLLRAGMSQVTVGAKHTLSLEAMGAAGALLGVKGGLEVKHETDGTYTVKLSASASAGIGAVLLGQEVTARAGIEPRYTFRFGSAEEAADRLTALLQAPLFAGPLGPTGRMLADDDAVVRMTAAATKNLESMRFELSGKAGAEVGLPVEVGGMKTKAKAQLGGKVSFEYDFAKRKLVQEQSLELSGGAGLDLKSIEKLLPKALTGAELKGSLAVRSTHDFGPEQLGRLLSADGVGAAVDAFDALHTPELVAKLQFKGAGVKASVEHVLRLDRSIGEALEELKNFGPLTDVRATASLYAEHDLKAKLIGGSLAVGYDREQELHVDDGALGALLHTLEFHAGQTSLTAAMLAVHHALSPQR